MTKTSLRIDRASPRRLLARLLDDPSLVTTVQSLAPRALLQLIDHIGLELTAKVPGASAAQFQQLAEGAKQNCPLSKALASVPEITLKATQV